VATTNPIAKLAISYDLLQKFNAILQLSGRRVKYRTAPTIYVSGSSPRLTLFIITSYTLYHLFTCLYKQLSDHFGSLERGRAGSMLYAPHLPPGLQCEHSPHARRAPPPSSWRACGRYACGWIPSSPGLRGPPAMASAGQPRRRSSGRRLWRDSSGGCGGGAPSEGCGRCTPGSSHGERAFGGRSSSHSNLVARMLDSTMDELDSTIPVLPRHVAVMIS
jgi:hypothetical protein